MKKPRRTYIVYRNGSLVDETWAVSEKQAINNVRHNAFGDFESQYEYGVEWFAELKYPPVVRDGSMEPKQMSLFGGIL